MYVCVLRLSMGVLGDNNKTNRVLMQMCYKSGVAALFMGNVYTRDATTRFVTHCAML
jgi:hypothetical protein